MDKWDLHYECLVEYDTLNVNSDIHSYHIVIRECVLNRLFDSFHFEPLGLENQRVSFALMHIISLNHAYLLL